MKEAFKGRQCDELSDLLIMRQLISTLSRRSLGFLINLQITTKRLHSAPGPCVSLSRLCTVSSFSLLSAFMKLSSPFTLAPRLNSSLSFSLPQPVHVWCLNVQSHFCLGRVGSGRFAFDVTVQQKYGFRKILKRMQGVGLIGVNLWLSFLPFQL